MLIRPSATTCALSSFFVGSRCKMTYVSKHSWSQVQNLINRSELVMLKKSCQQSRQTIFSEALLLRRGKRPMSRERHCSRWEKSRRGGTISKGKGGQKLPYPFKGAGWWGQIPLRAKRIDFRPTLTLSKERRPKQSPRVAPNAAAAKTLKNVVGWLK